jgi:hypothetical protein
MTDPAAREKGRSEPVVPDPECECPDRISVAGIITNCPPCRAQKKIERRRNWFGRRLWRSVVNAFTPDIESRGSTYDE